MDLRAIIGLFLRRILPAILLFGFGVQTLLSAGASIGQMLLGFLFFLIGTLFIAGPISQRLASPAGSLFWPRRYYDKPQPIYGIPQTLRKKGHIEEAIAEYERLAAAYPDETTPWLEMMDIALMDLRDPDRANAIYQAGIAKLRHPDDKDILAKFYAETRTRLDVRPPRPPLHLHRQ